MAANKFATVLHRNSNRFTLILVYALLEWTLILLLLLNSLFSYLIIKFADYFGLKRPCILCSRLDRFLESKGEKTSYRDLVCEAHAFEISKSGYCSNHRKLAESQDMCENCASSSGTKLRDAFGKFDLLRWMKQIGVVQDGVIEDVELHTKCSCCGVNESRKDFSSCFLVNKPSLGVLDYTQLGKLNLITDKKVEDGFWEVDHLDQSRSELVNNDEEKGVSQMVSEAPEEENCSVCGSDSKNIDTCENEKVNTLGKEEREDAKENDVKSPEEDLFANQGEAVVQPNCSEDKSPEILPQHLEFLVDHADYRLIPVELIDATMADNKSQYRYEDNEDFILDFDLHDEAQVEMVMEKLCNTQETVRLFSGEQRQKIDGFETMELQEKESFPVLHIEDADRDLVKEEGEEADISQTTENQTDDVDVNDAQASAAEPGKMSSRDCQGNKETSQMRGNDDDDDDDAEVSIGTEIPDHEHMDEIQAQESSHAYSGQNADPSTSTSTLTDDNERSKQNEEEMVEFNTLSAEASQKAASSNLYLGSKPMEMDEDKAPETPRSVDSLQYLHKKLVRLERKDSETEESLDGSVFSDIDSSDGPLTVERLKSALRAERKTLNVLYAELEEERSAAAVATSQTMAMINRLQEEKAAMQMEALQYQRMMEEQAEYDQEALQLLNELMVKREKEKQELESELEIYRNKVLEYESKEKLMAIRRSRTSSTCSNAEDSDGHSVDLNHEMNDDAVGFHQVSSNEKTPIDAVLCFEKSLADLEGERLSILDQLKGLEEKLMMLSDEDENFEDVRPINHYHEENGNGHDRHFDHDIEMNGHGNGFKEMNGKHQDRIILTSNAKRLLPLFDATETENGSINGHDHGYDMVSPKESSITQFERHNKIIVMEEEVDNVYARLQALESDREFLRHCISSLKKGDKGLDLLQEILQQLRDLRSVEFRVRNMVDGAAQ